ncbi:MAG: M23 family metallopeptidase [Prevotellaceae bacterium]|jgi:hypothetical protein|nr:M23 family metallopeptidase [Prevotellaceae bacterium]
MKLFPIRPFGFRFLFGLLSIVISNMVVAQVTSSFDFSEFRVPLHLPLSLSGNFGEFRSNHFHTGYDMRIGGVVGASVYAAADGYISRISVSPAGYGNAVYVDHPNATTSLYGHLLDFAPTIQRFVKEQQYENRSFSVNLNLSPEQFPVKKGDFLGRAGNSGASGGPHLHFEVRDTETQSTININAHGLYPVIDKIPPTMTRLFFYGYSIRSGIPLSTLLSSSQAAPSTTIIPVTDTFYIAIGAYDRMEGSNAFLALSSYEVYIDDINVYRYQKADLPPSMGRYLNSFLQYDQRETNNYSLLKTWIEPGNMLGFLANSPQAGLFSLTDTLVHRLKIVLTDDSGNQSEYRYKITKEASRAVSYPPIQGKTFIWSMNNYYETDGLQIYVPFGSLGKNIDFCVERLGISSSIDRAFYAPLWRIGSPSEPLFSPIRISIRAQVPAPIEDKAIIVSLSDNGKCSSFGGRWRNDYLETHTYNFGDYTVAVDTIPPVITPKFKSTDFRGTKQMAFTIKDELSGIGSFSGFIDEQWALFTYDAKSNTLSYQFDKSWIVSGKEHRLVLTVIDQCNNIATYKTTFLW